jgi:hypothetical protein
LPESIRLACKVVYQGEGQRIATALQLEISIREGKLTRAIGDGSADGVTIVMGTVESAKMDSTISDLLLALRQETTFPRFKQQELLHLNRKTGDMLYQRTLIPSLGEGSNRIEVRGTCEKADVARTRF